MNEITTKNLKTETFYGMMIDMQDGINHWLKEHPNAVIVEKDIVRFNNDYVGILIWYK